MYIQPQITFFSPSVLSMIVYYMVFVFKMLRKCLSFVKCRVYSKIIFLFIYGEFAINKSPQLVVITFPPDIPCPIIHMPHTKLFEPNPLKVIVLFSPSPPFAE